MRWPGRPERPTGPPADRGRRRGRQATATEFLDGIGWDAVDAGSLADSWRQEPGTPVYGPPYGSYGELPGTTADAETIRAALAAATRP